MPRADAQRNIDALLDAAQQEFAAYGVDVNVRAIAARAGVGTATLYRHFPTRSDLVIAVFRNEVDACATKAAQLAAACPPEAALTLWIDHYASFIASNRGLARALETGDPALVALPTYFQQRLGPALQALLEQASAARAVRSDIDPIDLLAAIAKLSVPSAGTDAPARAGRMIALLVDGLRYGVNAH